MRKILEERLENAKLDYQRCLEEIDYPLCKADELKGQVLAYQDCLNLFPVPRTEAELLKEFEKLGYEVVCNSDKELVLEIKYKHWIDRIHILKDIKKYGKSQCFVKEKDIYIQGIDMQEHKLLNELFEVWQWI